MNYSAQQILHVYKQVIKEKSKYISKFPITLEQAYGNLYVNISDVFCETGKPGLKYKSVAYGSVNYLGNINGKTAGNLYFKNEKIKKTVNDFCIVLDTIQKEKKEAVKAIEDDHGKPNPQHSILWAIASGLV